MHRALVRIPKEEASQARKAQRARLHAIRRALWNQMGSDPIRAAETLIKLEAREARLLGLDAPTRNELSGPEGAPVSPLATVDAKEMAVKLNQLSLQEQGQFIDLLMKNGRPRRVRALETSATSVRNGKEIATGAALPTDEDDDKEEG